MTLQIEHLSYRENRKLLLDDINLALAPGQIVGLLGANCAGKTTLMNLIVGLLPATKGKISIDGQTEDYKRKAAVSFSGQLEGIAERRTLAQIAKWFSRLYPDFDPETWQPLMAFMQLDESARLSSLSKGQREKAVIAFTLSRRTQLYLLDEPFSGIDSMARKAVIQSITKWLPERATLIISDHHIGDVATLLDRIVIIKDQRIIADEQADAIREQSGLSIEDYFEQRYLEAGD